MSYRHPLGQAPGSEGLPTELGQIVSKGGFRYQLTPEDILWLGRSVQFEGGGNPGATAWTYAQRLVALFPTWSLMRLVQAHSQPVNPIWRRDGEKCRPGGPYYGNQTYCSEAQLARRDRAATIPWRELRPDIRSLIARWAKAEVPNPVPRAADFANAEVAGRALIRRAGASRLVLTSGNWYITERQTNDWPADFVTIRHNGREAGPTLVSRMLPFAIGGVGFGLVAMAGGAGFLWWAWRRRQ